MKQTKNLTNMKGQEPMLGACIGHTAAQHDVGMLRCRCAYRCYGGDRISHRHLEVSSPTSPESDVYPIPWTHRPNVFPHE